MYNYKRIPIIRFEKGFLTRKYEMIKHRSRSQVGRTRKPTAYMILAIKYINIYIVQNIDKLNHQKNKLFSFLDSLSHVEKPTIILCSKYSSQ